MLTYDTFGFLDKFRRCFCLNAQLAESGLEQIQGVTDQVVNLGLELLFTFDQLVFLFLFNLNVGFDFVFEGLILKN